MPSNRLSASVRDALSVHALVLSDDTRVFALVSLDLIGFFSVDVQEIRKRAYEALPPGSAIIVCSTHTHSSPDVLGVWSDARLPGSATNAYIAEVVQKSADAVIEAYRTQAPAKFAFAHGKLGELVRNDRTPGLVDDAVFVGRITIRNQSPVTLVSFAAHPEFLRRTSLISSDFVGTLRKRLEGEKRLRTRVLFVNGALGGMVVPNTPHSSDRSQDMEVFTERVLKVLKPLLAQCRPVKAAPLRVAVRYVAIRLENPLFKSLLASGRLPQRLIDGYLVSEVILIRLGNSLLVATIPGEFSPEISFRIRALFPDKPLLLIGLANDELGYILPSVRYMEEVYAYERRLAVSPFIGEEIVRVIEELKTF